MPRIDSRAVTSAAIASLSFIAGCGAVTSVAFVNSAAPCPEGVCGALLRRPATFAVGGIGSCPGFRIDFGDGLHADVKSSNFGQTGSQSVMVQHTYTGWAGSKTVTVLGTDHCGGQASGRVRVLHESPLFDGNVIGYADPRVTCVTPNFPPLRKNTTVNVLSPVATPTNTVVTPVIDFCAFGCSYDADGIANSSATSPLPFPGMRQLSLVLRVGTETHQGGTHESFVTTQAGPLELCVNDDILWDDNGAWRIILRVDESAAP
jgi:hypothetical protein